MKPAGRVRRRLNRRANGLTMSRGVGADFVPKANSFRNELTAKSDEDGRNCDLPARYDGVRRRVDEQSQNLHHRAASFSEQGRDVEDGAARIVDDRVRLDHTAAKAGRQRRALALDRRRQRLHLLLPSGWQLSRAFVLLLESRRQTAVLLRVVFADDLD